MLLARKGLRVLLVDKAVFPSDIVKGNLIKPPGVERLARWGLLDELLATGCPPIRRRRARFGDLMDTTVEMEPPSSCLAPRRRILDWVLLQGAMRAGVEFREDCTLTGLVWDDGRVVGVEARGPAGQRWREQCSVVVGADGVRSQVARLVGSEVTAEWSPASAAFWAYWEGVPSEVPTVELVCDGRFMGAFPTHDAQSLLFLQVPLRQLQDFRADREANYEAAMRTLASDRVSSAVRVGRVLSVLQLPNFFRRSHGPGWVLVGDAGHHKDPLVARGISDAFRDADLAADAIAAGLDNGDLGQRLAAYERRRDDASLPLAAMNAALSRMDRPVDEMMQSWIQMAGAETALDVDLDADFRRPPVCSRHPFGRMERTNERAVR
jgi:2-polyprenyl-6-methoxyphenol hydroxylase-like FAD-dependent oxidoreductase